MGLVVALLTTACAPATTAAPTALPTKAPTSPPAAPTETTAPTATTEAASPTPSAPVEVTFGYSPGGTITDYYNALFTQAAKDMPDIKIVPVTYATYDDELNQLPTQFAAGTAPDVIRWDQASAWAEYASEGVLTPLDDLMAGTSIDTSAFLQNLIESWRINGKLYGMPSYLQNSAYVYNMDVLNEAGVTTLPDSMQEVQQVAQTVKDKTGKAGVVILPNLFHIYQYILAFGGRWNFGKTINSTENIAGLQFLVDLWTNGEVASTADQLGATWDGQAIAENKAAMSDGGPWYISFMQTTAPNVKYEMLPIPTNQAGKTFVTTYSGGYSISATAKDPEAAMKLIAYLSTDAAQEAIITTNLGFVPAMTKYIDQFRSATPEYAAFTESVLSAGLSLDYPPKTSQFETDLINGFQTLVFKPGTTTVKDLLDTLQQKYGQ
jgi:multiple sugar transport system substrate-binding protein